MKMMNYIKTNGLVRCGHETNNIYKYRTLCILYHTMVCELLHNIVGFDAFVIYKVGPQVNFRRMPLRHPSEFYNPVPLFAQNAVFAVYR